MSDFELIEFLALVIVFAPAFLAGKYAKDRKDIATLGIGSLFITLSILFTNLEAFFVLSLFSFLGHLSLIIGGIIISARFVLDLRKYQQEKSTLKTKTIEEMK